MADENLVEADATEVEYPEWYLENYKSLERFLALDDDGRGKLVGKASGIFGTILSALTPEGMGAVTQSGKAFFDTNMEAMAEKFAQFPKEYLPFLMLGVAIEAIGVQEMKIEEASAADPSKQ